MKKVRKAGWGLPTRETGFKLLQGASTYYLLAEDRTRLFKENRPVPLWQEHPRWNWEIGYPKENYPPSRCGTVWLIEDNRTCLATIQTGKEQQHLQWNRQEMIQTFLNPKLHCVIYEVVEC